MVVRPTGMGAFQFVTLAALRATQLTGGCLPRIDGGHTPAVTALLEVAYGKVMAVSADVSREPSETAEPSVEPSATSNPEG